jgi:hypothetical protein
MACSNKAATRVFTYSSITRICILLFLLLRSLLRGQHNIHTYITVVVPCPPVSPPRCRCVCINLLPTKTAGARVIHVLRSAVLSKTCMSLDGVHDAEDDTAVANFARWANGCSEQPDKEDDDGGETGCETCFGRSRNMRPLFGHR